LFAYRSRLTAVSLCIIISTLGLALLISTTISEANAHFFGGKTLDVDKYQITFVPYPETPVAGNNSTTELNFSVLENNSNMYNIYSALVISKADSGKVVAQYPYKFYEISDITTPHVFSEAGNYKITLQSRISGDPKYEASPLEASFDLPVDSPFQAFLSDRTALTLLIVIPTVTVGGVIFVYVWKKY
jgi:hypothetical protein